MPRVSIYRWSTPDHAWEFRLEFVRGAGWTIRGLPVGHWSEQDTALTWCRRYARRHGWVELEPLCEGEGT